MLKLVGIAVLCLIAGFSINVILGYTATNDEGNAKLEKETQDKRINLLETEKDRQKEIEIARLNLEAKKIEQQEADKDRQKEIEIARLNLDVMRIEQKSEKDSQKDIEIAKLNAELKKYEQVKLNQERVIEEKCSLFCDSTGYQPEWAQGMGDMQSNSKCINIVSRDFDSKDSDWCMEHTGKMLDDLN